MCYALQGDWAASLGFHPAGILVVFSLVGWVTWTSLEAWRGQALWASGRKTMAMLAGAGVALVSLVGWIVRF
jgi:hypothetical protein